MQHKFFSESASIPVILEALGKVAWLIIFLEDQEHIATRNADIIILNAQWHDNNLCVV